MKESRGNFNNNRWSEEDYIVFIRPPAISFLAALWLVLFYRREDWLSKLLFVRI